MAEEGVSQRSQYRNDENTSTTQSYGPSRSDSFDGSVIHNQSASSIDLSGLNIRQDPSPRPHDLSTSWLVGDDKPTLLSPISDEQEGQGNRRRNRSISFDPEAKLENGSKHTLAEPLPRTASLRSISTTDKPNNRRPITVGSYDSTMKINPFTGEPVKRRPRRQNTGSTGMSIMDAFAQNSAPPVGGDQLVSLTSESTMSPPQDEVATPLSPSMSCLKSSAASPSAVSPSIDNDTWPAFRASSIRSSRTFPSRPLSLRRESRRSSRRSASSSFSPAAIYLAKWGRDSSNVAPEPDDEGQSFGLENEYIIGRQIGYGGFSVVKEAFSVSPDGEKRKHAVKIVRKNITTKDEADNEKCQQELEHEVGIWKFLSNERILSLHAVFDTDFATFCVMDLNEGGTLYDLVRDSRKSAANLFASGLARTYAFQLAEALRYLHEDVRIVHRDVKMENCLIDRRPDTANESAGNVVGGGLRLCDFGLAEFIPADDSSPDMSLILDGASASSSAKAATTGGGGNEAFEVLGSLESSAPEALRTPSSRTSTALLSPAVDVWAFGVCLYTLIVQDRPFKDALASRVVELIQAAKWDEDVVKKAIGDDDVQVDQVLDPLRGCFDKDVSKRWDIGKVLSSAWFSGLDGT